MRILFHFSHFYTQGMLLAFTGAKTSRNLTVEWEQKREIITETEMEDTSTAANEETTAVIEFGVVATALFQSASNVNIVGADSDSAFVRVISWLTAAITWPDSGVCGKATILLIKILQFVS